MRKTSFGLILAGAIAATFVQTAATEAQSRRTAAGAEQANRQRGYYNQNGTRYYDGYPLSDWEKMRDRW
jgi:hypothetical protein